MASEQRPSRSWLHRHGAVIAGACIGVSLLIHVFRPTGGPARPTGPEPTRMPVAATDRCTDAPQRPKARGTIGKLSEWFMEQQRAGEVLEPASMARLFRDADRDTSREGHTESSFVVTAVRVTGTITRGPEAQRGLAFFLLDGQNMPIVFWDDDVARESLEALRLGDEVCVYGMATSRNVDLGALLHAWNPRYVKKPVSPRVSADMVEYSRSR
jgi:hypothetical protein